MTPLTRRARTRSGPLRIGIFTDYYLPSTGGTEVAVGHHRRMLESLGHEVFVVTADEPGREPDDHVVGLRAVGTTKDFNRLAIPPRGTTAALRRLDLDVVHSHTPFTTGLLADAVARDQDVPIVHTIHTLIPELAAYHPASSAVMAGMMGAAFYPWLHRTGRGALASPELPPGVRGMRRRIWAMMIASANTATILTTPSAHLDRRLREYGLTRPSVVLPNALDPRAFRAPAELPAGLRLPPADFRIVCVGRLTPEKRPRDVLQAFAGLGDDTSRQLVMVGGGPLLGECRELARSLGIDRRVVFTGLQPPPVVAALLQASDVFVIASQGFDNQPMVVLEAAAAGLPIVYRDAALTEALTPSNALLAAAGVPGLTAAFAELAGDRPRCKAMGRASLEEIEKYDATVLRHRLADVYGQAFELHAARH
jgi:1,2-diacylglycerol 3-alpha-glucosyltransferase